MLDLRIQVAWKNSFIKILYAAGQFGKERTIKEKVRKCRKPLENIYPSLLGWDAFSPSPSNINGISPTTKKSLSFARTVFLSPYT